MLVKSVLHTIQGLCAATLKTQLDMSVIVTRTSSLLNITPHPPTLRQRKDGCAFKRQEAFCKPRLAGLSGFHRQQFNVGHVSLRLRGKNKQVSLRTQVFIPHFETADCEHSLRHPNEKLWMVTKTRTCLYFPLGEISCTDGR